MSRPRRIRSRCWFFTKDNATDYDVALFKEYFIENRMDYVFQKERAESGMIHLQGVCRYENPRDRWPDLECHWERCKDWRKAVKYCSKLDTRIEGPWTNLNIKFRATVIDPLEGKELYPWQADCLRIINERPDNRKIDWIYGNGNNGKTTFVKSMVLRYGKSVVCCMGAGKDIFRLIANRLLEDEVDIKVVFFLLTRADENRMSYRALEAIKDGIIVSTKYEPVDLVFNSPHVIVMANFAPDLSMLSEDRWRLSYLN